MILGTEHAVRPREIGDYAIVGDGRSAALISRDGSIDWLCWPRFDSPSLFAALLDQSRGGRFLVAAADARTITRRYVGDTNVLETTYSCVNGALRVTDLMPVQSEEAKRRALAPAHEILRRLECIEGEVDVDVAFAPRPDYARVTPCLRDRGRLGVFCEHGDKVLALLSDFPLQIDAQASDARAHLTLRSGERRYLSLVFGEGEPAVLPMPAAAADARIAASLEWWTRWAGDCRYRGPYRDAVVRSALALKLMCYAPSGAVVAAPTTSLPEWPGGVRNWDYRYCWLRDASLTVQVLLDLGYPTEAESFLSWLLHTTRITWPELHVLYTVYGEPHVAERELQHLSGYADSRPVRIGNAAGGQLQLDVYGEVLDAVYQFVRRGGRLDGPMKRMITGFGETVCGRWREADEGIWEIRAGRREHTYSRGMCWIALDRLLKLHESGHLRVDAPRLADARAAIRDEIERRGFNARLGSYVSVLDGDAVDASLLKLARNGCVDATSDRMRSTLDVMRSRLGSDGLLYRYREVDDGLPPGEGAFGICSFWAVSAQALAGDIEGAESSFEHVLSYANDLGLFAEEIDPATGASLGNFPQAFTHVGLIDSALVLAASRMGGSERRATGPGRPDPTASEENAGGGHV